MNTRWSLFAQYWVALATIATVPIVVAGVAEGLAVRDRSYAEAGKQQVLEARQAAYFIERSILPPIDRLRIIANVPWSYPSATADEWLAEMRRLIRQFPLVFRVQRIDASGGIVNFLSQDGRRRPMSAGELDRLQRSSPVPLDRAPLIELLRNDGRVIAFTERGTGNHIVVDLSANVANDVVRSAAASDNNLVIVVDRQMAIIAHGNDYSLVQSGTRLIELTGWRVVNGIANIFTDFGKEPPAAPDGKAADPVVPPLEGSLGEIDAQVSTDPLVGTDWFAAYRRMPDLGWVVFALAPAADLHAYVRNAVTRTAVILITANAFAVLLALALARRMSRPLASLAVASERVAAGDMTARAAVYSDDDIGRVSKHFNSMVDQINQSYAELEEKVATKTHELELANRHKSEFLAQMSHELRTPLNAIIGFSNALKAQYFGPLNEKQKDYAQYIHASGQHLLALINDLLDLAKIESGRMDLVPSRIDVRSLLTAASALVLVRAHEKGLVLQQRVTEDVSYCIADERKLKQVLVNLLSNAVKFTPTGGIVAVSVHPVSSFAAFRPPLSAHRVLHDGADLRKGVGSQAATVGDASDATIDGLGTTGLEFRVTDTGIGIDDADRQRLFTEFGQIDRAQGVAQEGSGLGLALSQRFIALHGGVIEVTSEPGGGSSFYFTIPDRPWPAN